MENPPLARIANLRFRDPNHFVAGEIHNHAEFWQPLLVGLPQKDLLSTIIHSGVNAKTFFRHFKGTFRGQAFDSSVPPRMILPNASNCKVFEDFVSATIIEWIQSGSVTPWGKVGQCEPPHLVLPLTVEPTKPRLCHDERFLNLWVRDLPFKLDYITDLPRYVLPGHYQTVFDDKNGYQHVLLDHASRLFFGFQWSGWYFVFRVLPFGWKSSAYLYHTLGLAVTSHIRAWGIPILQYIDDRHAGQLLRSPAIPDPQLPSYVNAETAAYVACYVLIHAGYFIGLKKSQLTPSTSVRFLGFVVDSIAQSFRIPDEKRERFLSLLREVLASQWVTQKTFQRLAGKIISFSLAAPVCKLYTREVLSTISFQTRNNQQLVQLKPRVREELSYWLCPGNWQQRLPWRSERHSVVEVHTDASKSGWGAVLLQQGQQTVLHDYWQDATPHINVLEASALEQALTTLAPRLCDTRVDVWSDSQVVVRSWQRQGGRNADLNDIFKRIVHCARRNHFDLNIAFLPSSANTADAPSRILSDSDCSLTSSTWSVIQRRYGPHDLDLCALDSNAQTNHEGVSLPHFTPWPTPNSSGVNLFAQRIPEDLNLYIFPPIVLVGPVLRFLTDAPHLSVTIVVYDVHPRRYWWPLLHSRSIDSLLLGKKGDSSVLLFPSPSGFAPRPLQYDLIVFRWVW